MGKKIDFVCKIKHIHLTEEYRDMGEHPKTPASVKKKLQESEGQYSALLMFDKDTEEFLLSQGLKNEEMWAKLWGTDGEYVTLKVTRPHVNPKIMDDDTGKPLYYGPPAVVNKDGEPWDWDKDGIIGWGSTVKVRLDYTSKFGITVLEAVKVLELVEYESTSAPSEVSLEDF